jgi:hypothetical protein
MTSEQVRAVAGKYGKPQRIDYFIQILGGRRCHSRTFAQELRYCGKEMVVLSDSLKRKGYEYIQADTHKYIYKMEACGYTYIGATKDPFGRYVDHLVNSQTSSVIVVAAAIDNNLVPCIEIVDITDDKSSNGIEGFWIRYSKYKNWDVVNTIRNNDEFARFVEQKGDGFRSVIASKIMGYEATVFPALLVNQARPPIPMQELTMRFIPPWLAV